MLALSLSLALAQTPVEHTFPAGLRALDITTTVSDITVTTGGDAIVVKGAQRADDSMCAAAFGEGEATVTFGPRGSASNPRPCAMDMQITVPSGTSIALELGQGHLEITHDGGLHAKIGTGTVRGTVGQTSNLTVATGEVQLLQLVAPLELTIAKGAADLGWKTAPEGSILVNLADGDLRIDLPDDAPVDARVPPNVKVPQPQKTTAPTTLMIGRASGVVGVQ